MRPETAGLHRRTSLALAHAAEVLDSYMLQLVSTRAVTKDARGLDAEAADERYMEGRELVERLEDLAEEHMRLVDESKDRRGFPWPEPRDETEAAIVRSLRDDPPARDPMEEATLAANPREVFRSPDEAAAYLRVLSPEVRDSEAAAALRSFAGLDTARGDA